MTTDDRKRCKRCNVPLIASHGEPYTPGDDVDGESLCQWCLTTQYTEERIRAFYRHLHSGMTVSEAWKASEK